MSLIKGRQDRLMKAAGAAVFVLGVISIGVPSAHGQDVGPLMDRLERLERDIRTLNIQLSRGGNAAPSGVSAAASPARPLPDAGASRLTQRLDTLEQDLRSATGSLEELGHQIHQLGQRLEKLVGDVDYRLGVLENRAGVASAAAPAEAAPVPAGPAPVPATAPGVASVEKVVPTVAPAPAPGTLGTVSASALQAVRENRQPAPGDQPKSVAAATPPPAPAPASAAPASGLPAGSVRERYTYALNLLRQTNYDQAEIALSEFVKAHADDPLAGNARYWLGETYYVRADYEQAAQAFFAGYQSKPGGAKAPDMLLKLGMSLSQLQKKTEACATFDKLLVDFPQATARITSAVSRERKRAGCS